jgi:hypothetical protein
LRVVLRAIWFARGGPVGQLEPEPPGPGWLVALLHRRQVVAHPALPGDDWAFGGAGRLERVRGVVPAGDADDDRHSGLLSIFSTIFDLELN